jgi:hypothetical protein
MLNDVMFLRHTVYMIGPPAPPPVLPPTTLPPQPEHEPLPRQPRGVGRSDHGDGGRMGQQYGAPRPESRMEGAVHPGARNTRVIGMTLPNGSLGVLGSENEQGLRALQDVSGPGRSDSVRTALNTTAEQEVHTNHPEARLPRQPRQPSSATLEAESTSVPLASPDRHEHVQLPSYNEATERVSIFIDGYALQAIQESSEDYPVGFLEKIRAAQRDQYDFQRSPPDAPHLPPRPFTPPTTTTTTTTHRPLPPLPPTARCHLRRPEDVDAGYAHHCGSISPPMHPSTPDQMTAAPSHRSGRSERWVSGGTTRTCSATGNSRHYCDCILEHHPQFRRRIWEPHSSHEGVPLPTRAYRPHPAVSPVIESHRPALPDTPDLHPHHLAGPLQQPCNYTYTKIRGGSEASQARPPGDRIGVVSPLHWGVMVEESLHVDELNVPERKPLSKMEKALARLIEFGPKVDYSKLQLS